MYIQEIIIDGFKSYAQKTVVSGFDPQFNAITGLNGTGKSNILDSICFVLGISNLSQVRVGNLQELVYKQGQAGVTKATVTIIFNNSDASASPVGYEAHKQITVTRQVVIGGKNKYMINGHTAQQSQVQNLFHSVQLNVNNPHFLIMQGRITKVLNMKPPEILSMIEEAAGTRMFETKKQASLKTIEKKQLKVEEITKCIEEEITPTLDNLRHERQDYHTWQNNNTEYERLERFCIACDYQSAEEKVNTSEHTRTQYQLECEQLQSIQTEKTKLISQYNQQIKAIMKERDDQLEGEMKELKNKETELSKEVVKINTLYTNHLDSVKSEQEVSQTITKQLNNIELNMKQKGKEVESIVVEIVKKEEQVKHAEEEYSNMREKYQNAVAGVTDENTTELLSIPEQIIAWEKCERESKSKLQQNQQKQDFLTKQLKELTQKQKAQSSQDVLLQETESLKQQLTQKQQAITVFASVQDQMKQKKANFQATAQTLTQQKDILDSLTAGINARLSFDYRDPERGFDRQKVKGEVARLFEVQNAQYITALEIIAGGKLTQVVVDTEQTGKLLLQHGQLKRRVTVLPLNKIQGRVITVDRINRAKQIAKAQGGECYLALELITFDHNLQKAMEYVFGSVMVCSNSNIAKSIAFDKSLRLQTVTLEGDLFDPAGTLTGGSINTSSSILKKLMEYQSAVKEYQSLQQQNQLLRQEIQSCERSIQEYTIAQQEIELLSHTIQMNEQKICTSDYAQVRQQIHDIEQELTNISQDTITLQELLAKAKRELQLLTNTTKSISQKREEKMKEFENTVKSLQRQCNVLTKECNGLKAKRDGIQQEIKSYQLELTTLIEQQQVNESVLSKLLQEQTQYERTLKTLKNKYEESKMEVMNKSLELNAYNKEIQVLEQTIQSCHNEVNTALLEGRKRQHQLKQLDKEVKDAQKESIRLLSKYPWIESDKQYFGKPGTNYDFEQLTAQQLQSNYKRLAELKAEQERLTKKINKKVMGMIETAETEYEELNRKRLVILKDKAKIESVIEELDIQKTQALQKTWTQVNRDFGSIFSMLLPGTSAKLQPLESGQLEDGLEVKVAFGNIWKESLTELSGGQRSLLALSLILALLLFKPAPMYILDEVDAALDLSHTQNIGMMIKTHFSSSQFIVVSLKEGMFNNANVIFRTKFVDGVSMVTRTVAGARAGGNTGGGGSTKSSSSAMIGNTAVEDDNEDELEDWGEAAPVKKKGKKAINK